MTKLIFYNFIFFKYENFTRFEPLWYILFDSIWSDLILNPEMKNNNIQNHCTLQYQTK